MKKKRISLLLFLSLLLRGCGETAVPETTAAASISGGGCQD